MTTHSDFARPERLTVPVAFKLTPSEHEEVQMVIKDLQAQGIEGVTQSSLTRTALLTWIRGYLDPERDSP